MKSILFLFLFVNVISQADEGGLCTYSKSVPNLPRANCQFPSCAEGTDCKAPDIVSDSAELSYEEPTIRMFGRCPDPLIPNACWEVRKNFTFKLSAYDVSGVSAIGVHLAQETGNRRSFKKYWKAAEKPSGSDRFVMAEQIVAYVPMGGRLDIAVYELCARDGRNNEGCALPSRMNPFGYNTENTPTNNELNREAIEQTRKAWRDLP